MGKLLWTPYQNIEIPNDAVYCATPSRLTKYTDEIINFVGRNRLGKPFHPLREFHYEMYEGNSNVGRFLTMEICLRAVTLCDKFLIFGVSDGTLEEAKTAFQIGKPVQLHFNDWNPGDVIWKHEYERLGEGHGWPLDILLREF